MWLFARVDEHVFGEVTTMPERLVAHFTCMWLFASVDEHMLDEVSTLPERLVALFTYV